MQATDASITSYLIQLLSELKEAEHMQAGSRIDYVAVDLVVRDLLFWVTWPQYRSVCSSWFHNHRQASPKTYTILMVGQQQWIFIDSSSSTLSFRILFASLAMVWRTLSKTLKPKCYYIITAADAERSKCGRCCSITGANVQYHVPGASVAAGR
eukprot:SAG31_NODE_9872_length_1218_cov_1.321716_1_plen_154_part_00